MQASKDIIGKAASAKWLSIVGIGQDGVDGLSMKAQEAISSAAHVFGGTRHLRLAHDLINGKSHPWPQPFDVSMSAVIARRFNNVCVLASGDPYFHGVGATLSRLIAQHEIHVIPAPSSYSLAAARLGWPLHDIELLSLHGFPLSTLRPHLQPGRRILALTSGSDSPAKIASYLSKLGFAASTLTVLEALGGHNEKVSTHKAASFPTKTCIQTLNIVAIEVVRDSIDVVPMALTPGLPNDCFEHDGQITKHNIRALALSALAPCRGELLWDIGAGAGSIAIEWMLAHKTMRAIAIEKDEGRAARINRNADLLGVPDLQVVTASAPKALAVLPQPDAIFIGGGGTTPGLMTAAIVALPEGGRLLAHSVTLEMEAVLFGCWRVHGGALTKLSLSHAQPLGSMTTWRSALPVTQWSWTKPSPVHLQAQT